MVVAARPRILITHPGRQHSHQAAIGLAGAGMLAGYWSGVPSLSSHARWVPRRWWSRYEVLSLPPGLVATAPWVPALRRLADRLPGGLARRVDFTLCRLFDRWAALRLANVDLDAVLACEISALATFRTARRRGIMTLLDAPSIHHRAQDLVQATLDPPALHTRLCRHKDAEVMLADHVIAVSELARQTYLDAGVPGNRVHAVTLGAEPSIFAPASFPGGAPFRVDGPSVTFLFAGAAIHRKGVDWLLAAFRTLRASGRPTARLRVVGPAGDASDLLENQPGVERVGPLDQGELARELQSADCLVLPSRHDSFGMVVVEALAAGTPVILSEMVGAKDLVQEEVNGWVLPLGDVSALTDRMAWCSDNLTTLRSMRPACRESARSATWEAYHQRFVALIDRLLQERGAPSPERRAS